MTAKLLCCVNASAHARPAIELSTEIAKGLGRRLVFLLVNQTRPASGYPDIRAMRESEARDVLDVALRYAETHGVQDARTALIEARDVADAILGFADEQEFGHIVLGKGNPPFIGRLLLGSVSEAVVTRAKCSVTVAR
jgi:nucleotide-binding universal stress UspA family protein